MLFNSHIFIFIYLPITLVGFVSLGRLSNRAAIIWLTLASLFFYGYWNPSDVAVLCASVIFNYILASWISYLTSEVRRKYLLAVAIFCNLSLLAYFKYARFVANEILSLDFDTAGLIAPSLPLGISFFTFTQIAFLVDCYQRKASEHNFSSYFLFVTYFPHLIAGPVLHHKEMMPQFNAKRVQFVDGEGLAVGLTMFSIGLFKKVVLADSVAGYADAGFGAASSGVVLTSIEAWSAALSYTFQLYFDFSGYSDMAIGLSRLFGIRLPINFDSPYKATSISDFWRRWHMTLSRFLRDYLYVPLGGNRKGPLRRYANLLITMVLGGLWHGAGWTFIAWGALHGAYLCIDHGLSALRRQFGRIDCLTSIERLLAWLLTFAAVVVAWVFFRADTINTAMSIITSMFSSTTPATTILQGVLLPAQKLPGIATNLGGLDLLRILGLFLIATLLPNSQEWLCRYRPALEHARRRFFFWSPHWGYGLGVGALFGLSVSMISSNSTFLYFNF